MELSSLSFDLARLRKGESDSHAAMGSKPGEKGIFLPLLKQLESCCVGSLTPETRWDHSKQLATSLPYFDSKDGGIRNLPAAKGIETMNDVRAPVSDVQIAEQQVHQSAGMPFLPYSGSGDAVIEPVDSVGWGGGAAPQIVDWERTASRKVTQTVTSDSGRTYTDTFDVGDSETIAPRQIHFSTMTSGTANTASSEVSIQITNKPAGIALSIWVASEKTGVTPELREALEAEIMYHGCRLAGLQFNGFRSFSRGGK